MATEATIDVQARARGLWLMKVATVVLRLRRPRAVVGRLAAWLIDGKVGVDVRAGKGKWDRSGRVKAEYTDGDE